MSRFTACTLAAIAAVTYNPAGGLLVVAVLIVVNPSFWSWSAKISEITHKDARVRRRR